MTILNKDSTRLLSTAFPNGGAYIVVGHHDAKDEMVPYPEGPIGAFDLPDDADLYYCIATVAAGKTRSDIGRVMVLVIDDIGKEIKGYEWFPFLPEPSFVVESSEGSFQYGYIIDGGMEPDEYRALRRAMKGNKTYGAAHNTGAPALFRLPQGMHTKSTRNKWKVRLTRWTGRKYTPAEMWAATGSPIPAKMSGNGKPDPVANEELLAKLVRMIPNPVADWDYLVDVGRAIWGASNGEAVDIYHEWAAKFSGHDPAVTQARWDSYHDARIGRYWLLREAMAADPVGAEAWLRDEAKVVFPVPTDVPESDPDEIEALQRDVANWIVRRWGDRIRYNVSTSMWHRFDGTWRESPHPLGYRLAKRWADDAAPQLGKAARAAVSKSAFYDGVDKILRADPKIAVVKTDFDRDDWLLGTPGGTVDLKTGVLRAAVAAEMISLSCAVTPAVGEDCPKWLKFVRWVCTDPATGKVHVGMLKTLKQWAGYCLTGDVSEEMVMFFHGGGANGKGTFIETMQSVMGDYFYLATKDLFMETKFGTHTEETAALAGKRMVAADEVPTNARWNESLLKACSGGGTMSSRHLYGKVFKFPINFKVTIIGNNKPAFQGAINDALKRRLHLAAFSNKADPPSKTLKAELRAEGAGVLRWALNGLMDMLDEPGSKMFIADSIIAATDEYFSENDLFGEWLSSHTRVTPGVDCPAGEAFNNWKEFRNEQGNFVIYKDHKEFKAEMLKRGKTWKEGRLGSIYKDLSLIVVAFAGGSGG